jgi:formylglycine-generating enzyme required for sulfatase activity
MGRIPEATFRMGSEIGEPDEMPVHTTHVASFEMDLTEVTVRQYTACVEAGACPPAPRVVRWPGVTSADEQLSKDMCNENRADRQDHAINCVDWDLADTYCRWAGKRLPSEEEWEYAACGGNCDDAMKGELGHATVQNATRWPFTGPVATTWPGPFGLYDMAGNVWEWTASPYCPYDHSGCNDARRVVRGGSWSVVDYLFVRLTDRSPNDASTRNTNLGFRCARSLSP